MRRRGLDISGCLGSNSTESGVQWIPSITAPSLIAIKCRLVTMPSIAAIYLQDVMLHVIRICRKDSYLFTSNSEVLRQHKMNKDRSMYERLLLC